MEKYLIGSKLLGLANPKDTDYLILNKEHQYKRVVVNNEDILYMSYDYFEKCTSFSREIPNWYVAHLFNYQLDESIRKDNFPLNFNILDFKSELISLLKYIAENSLMNLDTSVTVNRKYCSKCIYHIAYNLFIVQNNSTVLTEEQKTIIQKIHDKLMPIEYVNTLKSQILTL